MIVDLNEDEKGYLLRALHLLKILKYMEMEGYHIPEIYIKAEEDMYNIMEEYMEKIWQGMGCTVDWEYASDESGEAKGYSMMFSQDEITVIETMIKHPELTEYLEWAKANGMARNELPIADMGFDLIAYCYTDDYTIQEAFITEDLSGLCILQNTWDFVDFDFIEKFVEIIDFCRYENQKRKREQEQKEIQLQVLKPTKNKKKRRRKKKNKRKGKKKHGRNIGIAA